ncbi:choice-of-anchor Q domain-containing protein [Pontiella agarivorans]|uniref:Choice-of-anchor Q domain-containing protein n=1 Tax=Pontiella agarivorans TaxID=3038953 RepID=A0ABU5N219_9BACT|nr:choice-of-anchor Q domain-containing protein [Pontiella agarivorans]MDZ8120469.1 choice-of-anchor Q domain-containing protein [Pontiella agarivorans]
MGGSVELNKTHLRANSAQYRGGGIFSASGAIVGKQLLIEENTAETSGDGGIAIGGGDFTLVNSAVINNDADAAGGGYLSLDSSPSIMSNVTFALNTSGGYGSAISAIDGGLKLYSCTIAENVGYGANSVGVYNQGFITAYNSIIANNIGYGGASANYNNSPSVVIGTHNLINGAPMLAAPSFYGSETITMPPLPGSPAIDGGYSRANTLAVDQRDAPRISGTHIDIGAVEIQQLVVNTTTDENDGIATSNVSLRDAVDYNSAVAFSKITFDPALQNQTILLTNGRLDVTESVTIDASALPGGMIIDGNGVLNSNRIFGIYSNTTNRFDSLILSNGWAQGVGNGGGAISILPNAALTLNNSTLTGNWGSLGGALLNQGDLIINNSIFKNNSASSGAGLAHYGPTNTASLLIQDSLFTNNYAYTIGGGLYIYSGDSTLTNTVISDNSANNAIDIRGGGGVFIREGSHNLQALQLENNAAVTGGGGLYLADGSLDISDSEVENNAARNGGGLYLAAGNHAISNTAIHVNTATLGNGGGIYAAAGSVSVRNSSVNGNRISSSSGAGGGIYSDSAAFTIATSTVSQNFTAGAGGGIYLNASPGSLNLTQSTLAGNHASRKGGALYLNAGASDISSSTVAHNRATMDGGGFYLHTDTLELDHVTIADNIAVRHGGAIYNSNAVLRAQHTTIATNRAYQGYGGIYNLAGTTELNHVLAVGNLNSSNTTVGITGSYSGTHNIIDGPALLAPLGNYGGLTETMPPLMGSSAIDTGVADENTPNEDQRGMPRVMRSGMAVTPRLDIGAVEFNGWLVGEDLSLTDPAYLLPGSIYDAATVFPVGFDPIAAGMQTILSPSGRQNLIAQGESNVTDSPEVYGLYTEAAFQALALDRPFLTYNAASNSFTLSIGILKTPDLISSPFTNLTGFTATPYPGDGRIDIEFTAPNADARFYEVYGSEPPGP